MQSTKTGQSKQKPQGKVSVYINPGGIIEQHSIGNINEELMAEATDLINKCAVKLRKQKKPVLILIGLSELGKSDMAAHKAAIKGVKSLRFKRMAAYGPLYAQVIVNTLILI